MEVQVGLLKVQLKRKGCCKFTTEITLKAQVEGAKETEA